MIKPLGKNYYFDDQKKLLYRLGLNEKKHLMWCYGGISFFQEAIFNEYKNKIEWVGARTDKHRFTCKIDFLKEHPLIYNNKGERQVSTDKYFWQIGELEQQEMKI